MSTPHSSYTTQGFRSNLIGDPEHRQFIGIQALYGIAQRGGVTFPFQDEKHGRRLVSDINLFSQRERRALVLSETLFSN